MSDVNNTAQATEASEGETKRKGPRPLAPTEIELQTLPKGKAFERYDLGDYRSCDMSLPAERDAALMILSHILDMRSSPDYSGFGVYIDPRVSDAPEDMNKGSFIFDGKTIKSGDESVLAYVSVAYMPPADDFYKAAHELTRRAVQKLLADYYAGIISRHLAIADDGSLTIKGEIPIDPADILAPTARGSARDPYLWALMAIVDLRLRKQVKIASRDLRLVLTSEAFARNSAYKSLEAQGLFVNALHSVNQLLEKAATDEATLAKVVEALSAVAPKSHKEEVTPDFIKAWHASSALPTLIANRPIANVKIKAAGSLSDVEKQSLDMLFG